MHWQDYVFTVGLLVFGVALTPSLVGKSKPALWTSVTTGGFMLIFAATYATLHFWFTATTQLITACIWLTLAWQKLRQERAELGKQGKPEAGRLLNSE